MVHKMCVSIYKVLCSNSSHNIGELDICEVWQASVLYFVTWSYNTSSVALMESSVSYAA